jgi:hypothetical protein
VRISTFSDGIAVLSYKRLFLYTRDPTDSSRLMSPQRQEQTNAADTIIKLELAILKTEMDAAGDLGDGA